MTDFRPLGVLADDQVMRLASCCGHSAVRILTSLREHGAVRTLPEIWAEVQRPVPELTDTLERLERAGLIQWRDMVMDHGTEPVWWAPRVVHQTEGRA